MLGSAGSAPKTTASFQRRYTGHVCNQIEPHLPHLLLWPTLILSYYDNFGQCNFSLIHAIHFLTHIIICSKLGK